MLPLNYNESRIRFRQLAASVGAHVATFSPDASTGSPMSLTTDVAYLGDIGAPTLVVVSSGTHGVEGYIGAACQFRFMQRQAHGRSSKDVGILLVHAVNAWGYAHDRRVTEEGIDLNRNFIDFSTGFPSSEYRRFHSLLVDDYRPMPAGLGNRIRVLWLAAGRERRRQLQAALTAGQYDVPDGMFFGGRAPAKARVVWERILHQYGRNRRQAVLLDIHSGLGRWGHGELISDLPSASAQFQRLAGWFGNELRSMADGASVSTPVRGTLTSAFSRTIGTQADAIGLEFGTCTPFAVLDALRADHWAAKQPESEKKRAAGLMKAAFAPAAADWHAMAISRFDDVIGRLVVGATGNAG